MNQFLADCSECGRHLCHAMLLPRQESAEALARFRRDGTLDLGTARVERHGKAAVLLLSNKRLLNSEDNATQTATEIGAQCASSIPTARSRCCAATWCRGQICRPSRVQRRHQPQAYLLRQDPLPVVPGPLPGLREQDVRGLARPEVRPDEVSGDSIESCGSRRSRPSRSAAAARSCWRPTSTSPRATPT